MTRLPVVLFLCASFAGAALAQNTPAAQAKADSGVQKYTAADVRFMQDMIHHHAQALAMVALVNTHGASDEVKTLAGRIDVGQHDEIAFMERWLRDRHQEMSATHDHSMHEQSGLRVAGGMPDTLMPGMLTEKQFAQLSAATGKEFDDLFLRFMIQHHSGALTMVDRLFATPGAGQEEYVFRFATDVTTDQTTEIERMQTMLAALSTPPKK